MIFCSEDGLVCVNLLFEAREAIEKEMLLHHPYETGGILIGKYDENLRLATVYLATASTKDSKHHSTTFRRGTNGIMEAIKHAQMHLSPELHYVGEWHSHPNSSPTASYIDLNQMQIFAKRSQLGIRTPLLLIVGGSPPKKLSWSFRLHRYKKLPLFLSLLNDTD